jgi:hypothetical protein
LDGGDVSHDGDGSGVGGEGANGAALEEEREAEAALRSGPEATRRLRGRS